MKNLSFVLLFGFILIFSTCQPKVDIEKEKEAIKAVIEEETNAFLARDFDRLAATYIQDETNTRLSSSKSAYQYNVGWSEISSMFKQYFENPSNRNESKYVKTDYKIKVYEGTAWETNNEVFYDNKGEVIGKLIVTRFLEKVNNEWKIAYLSVVNASSYDEKTPEEQGN